ncbi:uncharacterized protein [Notamacropus eugenii]|uniref:uncharacterized protein n=1 Tax=Notamacropus eugenii TaxID=9315 RepID=UPI003B684F95
MGGSQAFTPLHGNERMQRKGSGLPGEKRRGKRKPIAGPSGRDEEGTGRLALAPAPPNERLWDPRSTAAASVRVASQRQNFWKLRVIPLAGKPEPEPFPVRASGPLPRGTQAAGARRTHLGCRLRPEPPFGRRCGSRCRPSALTQRQDEDRAAAAAGASSLGRPAPAPASASLQQAATAPAAGAHIAVPQQTVRGRPTTRRLLRRKNVVLWPAWLTQTTLGWQQIVEDRQKSMAALIVWAHASGCPGRDC